MIDNIRKKLEQALPGRTAQLKMAPAIRQHYRGVSDDAIVACVLILLFPKNDEWNFTLIQRMPHEKDRHSGQISFPGGRLEPDDESLLAGALREAEEEVGIPRTEINVLGRLTELFIPVSNYLVHPFVGFLEKTPEYTPQPSEVASILEIPISELNKLENKKTKDISGGKNIILKNVPYFDFDGKVVWGATAMMLSEFEEVVFDN